MYTLNQLPNINSRPATEYKAYETSVIIDGKEYRAIVFHSTSYDKRRQKKIDKQIGSSFIPKTGSDSLDCEGVLRTYKGQYSIESDFAFLKDPLIVNDLFIKTPSRIDALGMILIIALMIYRLMERTMRQYLQENNTKVPGWDKKPTDKPTAYMLLKNYQRDTGHMF